MFKVKDEKLIPMYIGDCEVYIPYDYKGKKILKVINKGDLIPEMPIKEAKGRSDITVVYESEVKNDRI